MGAAILMAASCRRWRPRAGGRDLPTVPDSAGLRRSLGRSRPDPLRLSPCYLDPINRNLIEQIVHKLAGKPNVIYEIMNEPLVGESGSIPIRDWHGWVGGIVKSTN